MAFANRLAATNEDGGLDGVESAVAFLLKESSEGAKGIAAEFRRSIANTRAVWELIGTESVAATQARLDAIDAPDARKFGYFMSHEGRGMVLLTIHLGSYLPGIFRLLQELGERKVFIVRRTQTGTSEFEAGVFGKLQSLGVDFEVVRLGGKGVWRLVKGLKQGGVAVMPFDLPREWGPTVSVEVLNTRMDWVRGPYEIGARSSALLVPFLCVHHDVVDSLLIGRIVPLEQSAHRNREYVLSVAQQCADGASAAIRAFPGQWHHWTLLGEMTTSVR